MSSKNGDFRAYCCFDCGLKRGAQALALNRVLPEPVARSICECSLCQHCSNMSNDENNLRGETSRSNFELKEDSILMHTVLVCLIRGTLVNQNCYSCLKFAS